MCWIANTERSSVLEMAAIPIPGWSYNCNSNSRSYNSNSGIGIEGNSNSKPGIGPNPAVTIVFDPLQLCHILGTIGY